MPIPQSASHTDQPLRHATLDSLVQIFEPLANLMIESGITAAEACQVLRQVTVQMAARRVQTDTGQASKSRVAAMTGLSRSEVSRLWKLGGTQNKRTKSTLRPAQRILTAWYNSPTYLTATGDPETIPIFGARRSFQRLVALNGAGVPVRAMLDELVSIGAVELLTNQRVRAKARIPVHKGMNSESIRSIGERASELLGTLINNLVADTPLFEASTGFVNADPASIALIRREMASRGSSFFSNIEHLLKNAPSHLSNRIERNGSDSQIGVGIYYFEKHAPEMLAKSVNSVRRKNLRRKNTENK